MNVDASIEEIQKMEPTPNAIEKDMGYAVHFAPDPTGKTITLDKTPGETLVKIAEDHLPKMTIDNIDFPESKIKGKPEHGKTDNEGFYGTKRLHEMKKDGTFRTWPEGKYLKRKKGWQKEIEDLELDYMSEQQEPYFESTKQEYTLPPLVKEDPVLGEEQTGEKAKISEVSMDGLDAAAIAQFLVDQVWIQYGYAAFGDEWLPKSMPGNIQDERSYLIMLWTKQLQDSEVIKDLPEWVLLLIAHSNWTTARLFKQNSKTLARVKGWFSGVVKWWKARREKREKKADKKEENNE